MVIQDRDQSRGVFFETWAKYGRGEALSPLERLVLGVILEHPEYHGVLADAGGRDRDYDPGAGNPFLHMGMHIAIREQVGTDRPPGVAGRYRALLNKTGDDHKLQHRMMSCLEEALWRAREQGAAPDEAAYLKCLGKLGE